MTTELAGLRVLVTHDWLIPWGGAERVLTEIMNIVPQADLVVGVREIGLRERYAIAARARETWVGLLPFARARHRWFVPLHYAAFAALNTRPYDLVISSSHAFAKAVTPMRGKPHVCYCHSPPRYFWDMRRAYREQSGPVASVALGAAVPLMRWLDQRSAAGVTHFVGNSRFVAQRIRSAYGRDSAVVYPPVVPKADYQPNGGRPAREDFLLVLGRLVAYKRVDLAIQAAERLRIPLVVAGDGRERANLQQLAGRHTTFLGEVDEATAADLMERCRAFVFCAEEDFGIAPVEANAHGAPVVGYSRGGLAETMVDGVTAELFSRQTVDDVERAIQDALSRPWDDAAIRDNARRFSAERFRREFADVLCRAVSEESSRTTP